MRIRTALEIADNCISEDKLELRIPKDVTLFQVLWALRVLAGSYRRTKQALDRERGEK